MKFTTERRLCGIKCGIITIDCYLIANILTKYFQKCVLSGPLSSIIF